MAVKSIVFYVSAFLLQSISAQCVNAFNPGFAGPALAAELSFGGPYGPNLGCGCGGIDNRITPAFGIGNGIGPAACAGPVFPAPCAGPILPAAADMPPPGMSIYSDNLVIDGPVVVTGRMPFLGTVAMEGVFPTAGAGAVSYGCGDGAIGIVAEGPIAPGLTSALEYGPAYDGFMYNGLAGPNGVGCGGRVLY